MGVTGIILVWANLWVVALPFLTSACVAGVFTVLLSRVSRTLTHHRLVCTRCAFEGTLITKGECHQNCAVNSIPSLPLLLFFFCIEFALLSLFYPSIAGTYILPGSVSPLWNALLQGLMLATTVASSVMLGVYLIQHEARARTWMLRGALVGTLGAILVASLYVAAAVLVPIGLFALLLSLGVELRARHGLPLLGLRAIGLATLPLFLVVLIGMVRIYEIFRLA
jgi:uncharacterized membrane protein YozB (DUF420 family)